jgi:hypothetical protein
MPFAPELISPFAALGDGRMSGHGRWSTPRGRAALAHDVEAQRRDGNGSANGRGRCQKKRSLDVVDFGLGVDAGKITK